MWMPLTEIETLGGVGGISVVVVVCCLLETLRLKCLCRKPKSKYVDLELNKLLCECKAH